jgi:hypothetical protein
MWKLGFWPFRQRHRGDCYEAREMAYYLVGEEGDAPPGLIDRLRAHMGFCPPCAAFLRTLQSTVGLVQNLPPQSAPETLRERLRRIPGSGEEE